MLLFYSFLFPTNLLFKVRMVASLVMMMNGHLNMSSNHQNGHSTPQHVNHPKWLLWFHRCIKSRWKKGEVAAISPGMFLFLLSFLLTTTIVGLCNGLKRVQIDRIYMPLFGP